MTEQTQNRAEQGRPAASRAVPILEARRQPHSFDPEAERSVPEDDKAAPRRPGRKRRLIRRALLLLGPLAVLAVGIGLYLSGGRYVATENAYLQADMVMIAPQVAGPIARVAVTANQEVETGQVLFSIDPAPFRLALDKAQAKLAATRSDVEALKATYAQKQEQLKVEQSNLAYAQQQFNRQSALASKRVATQSALDEARRNLQVARDTISVVQHQIEQVAAQLGGDPNLPVEQEPSYREALAARDQAQLDLEHTVVRAPFAGVTGKKPELGQYVSPGSAVIGLVADRNLWIDANFKETELTDILPGQPVTIEVDTYPDHRWHGTVESISQATGSEFSVLPAQNATGNWVKVVQRIPVRIAVEADPDGPQLRAGMSTWVQVDTGRSRTLADLVSPVLKLLGVETATATASK
ncbi:HlyD family secretion protein [Tistlia consotensis]|uniref:HlyD family secretion protein n=1 Tax=Tistlia consotensis TaxID=1321365 RepID=UPI00190EE001|nr:HlyD family secretion protein [Tistlia consotensis]